MLIHVGGYAWSWYSRAPEGADAVRAFLDQLGDYFLLGWVERYQTLLGGIIAAAAAAFIIVNTLVERSHKIRDDKNQRSEQLISAIAITAFSLRSLGSLVLRRAVTQDEYDRHSDAIRTQSGAYAADAKALCNILLYCLEVMRSNFVIMQTQTGKARDQSQQSVTQYASIMATFMDEPREFVRDGKFKFQKIEVPEADRANFNLVGMQIQDAEFVKMLFKF
ncbi:hypothetical protein [Devosia beringensis]|uniref:hypothetical protein n=1 Tax=Devosia beringensis TaxID=2657486 RepID=UPI00186B6B11|nr:hypothetical protein [Devosia beringensis]